MVQKHVAFLFAYLERLWPSARRIPPTSLSLMQLRMGPEKHKSLCHSEAKYTVAEVDCRQFVVCWVFLSCRYCVRFYWTCYQSWLKLSVLEKSLFGRSTVSILSWCSMFQRLFVMETVSKSLETNSALTLLIIWDDVTVLVYCLCESFRFL